MKIKQVHLQRSHWEIASPRKFDSQTYKFLNSSKQVEIDKASNTSHGTNSWLGPQTVKSPK
jgi:hypothetical protein